MPRIPGYSAKKKGGDLSEETGEKENGKEMMMWRIKKYLIFIAKRFSVVCLRTHFSKSGTAWPLLLAQCWQIVGVTRPGGSIA